jgi:membrane-associated PAP2 superfamily phosphatase
MFDAEFTGTWYLALFVGDPMTTSGAEVAINTTTGYARQAVTFAAAAARAKATNSAAVFPAAGASWGTIDHLALFAAATGGSPAAACTCTGTAVGVGVVVTVASGAFSLTGT